MKNWLKVFALAAIVGTIAIAYMWFFVYNKPHKNIEEANPDYVISAANCYNHYSQGKNTKEKNYTGKVLQITGETTSVESHDSTAIVVFAFNTGMFGDEGIRCTMLPSYKDIVLKLKYNESITVKGYCAGYNETDVILEQCSIITNNN